MNRRPNLGLIVIVAAAALCVGPSALAQVDWTYQEVAVIPGPPGTWNSANHHLGKVIFDGTTYHMYMTGGQTTLSWESAWAVGHWTSNSFDGPWDPDPDNPVLEVSAGQWDGFTIYNIAVYYDGSSFRMWYSATDSYLGIVRVGLATDADGDGDWTKHPGNPLPGLVPGGPGSWDDGGLSPNTVLFDGSVYGMWYTAVKDDGYYGDWSIGYAWSTDGLTWTKHPDPLLTPTEPWEGDNVYFAEVVPLGDGFAMWYSGLTPGYASIGYAVSPDGLHWGKHPANPILPPQPGCDVVDSFSTYWDGVELHGWTNHCFEITRVTAPLELLFFDGFESGSTSIWSTTAP